jgi:hypothetical protein
MIKVLRQLAGSRALLPGDLQSLPIHCHQTSLSLALYVISYTVLDSSTRFCRAKDCHFTTSTEVFDHVFPISLDPFENFCFHRILL